MNRQQFTHARRVARTFHTYCEQAIRQHLDGDNDMANHCSRWFNAIYLPLADQHDLPALWAHTCSGPSDGSYGANLRVLAQHRGELRRHLSHHRLMAAGVPHRVQRYPLPA